VVFGTAHLVERLDAADLLKHAIDLLLWQVGVSHHFLVVARDETLQRVGKGLEFLVLMLRLLVAVIVLDRQHVANSKGRRRARECDLHQGVAEVWVPLDGSLRLSQQVH
jgi:hypothetical protein